MSIRWDDLSSSGFFQWFGVTETGREPSPLGESVICKPGGHQEHIDLSFAVDGEGNIARAELILDRVWIHNRATAPFAADIAKSFVSTISDGDPKLESLARQLELMMGSMPGVISRQQPFEPPPSDIWSEVTNALGVFTGASARAEVLGPDYQLVLANTETPRGVRLFITWTASRRRGLQALPGSLLSTVRRGLQRSRHL